MWSVIRSCAVVAAVSFIQLASSSLAYAQEGDVDINTFEHLDVIETTDGSVWKGVIIEQMPNVRYRIAIAGGSVQVLTAESVAKITKQRNPNFRGTPAAAGGPIAGAGNTGGQIGGSYQPVGGGLPKPFATTGARIEPELAVVFPTGDIGGAMGSTGYSTSFAPTVRVGYEALFGNFGVGGGGQARFTYWLFPVETNDAHWTLETQLYGRVAMHISRVNFYGGIAIGIDTNYVYVDTISQSQTAVGLGMNLQTGVEIAATPAFALRFGLDYHPGTDKIVEAMDASVSYFALLFGGNIRL